MIGPFGNMFPYTNFHGMNTDWLIGVAKDFLDNYSTIEQMIDDGEQDINNAIDRGISDLNDKKTELEGLLDAWYTEHSEDIAGELADALEDLNAWYTEHSGDISAELTQAIADFGTAADEKAALAISTIPGDYSDVAAQALSAVKAYGTMISSSALLDTVTGNTKSAKDFPLNSIVMVGALNIGLLDYPSILPDGETGTYITYCDAIGVTRGIVQLYINKHGVIAFRYKYTDTWTNWNVPIQGEGLMVSSAANLSTITGGTKSCNDFPDNTVQLVGLSGASIGLLDYPTNNNAIGRGTYITLRYNTRTDTPTGKTQLYIDMFGRLYVRCYYTDTVGWSHWKTIGNDVAYVNCNFPNAEAGFTSSYYLEAGKTYYMRTNLQSTVNSRKLFNVFVVDHYDDFVRCTDSWIKWTAPYDGWLRVANRDSYTGTMILEVRPDTPDNRLVWETPDIYHIYSTDNYTSTILGFVKGCLTEETGYESNSEAIILDSHPKIIYIHSGTYNVFNEYVAETQEVSPRLIPMSDIPDDPPAGKWFGKYNAILPPNTKLIGVGDVTLQFTPSTAEIGIGASKTWSPLNIISACHIENITIMAKNCRYGIHDDPGTGKYIQTEHVYKNVRVLYEEDDDDYGRLNTIGFGFNQEGHYIFDDCEFLYDGPNAHGIFYGHDSGTGHAVINIKDCIIRSTNSSETKGIRLQTIQSTPGNPSHNYVKIDNTYIDDGIDLNLFGTTQQQAFEVVGLKSGTPTVRITKPSGNTTENPYNPVFYN